MSLAPSPVLTSTTLCVGPCVLSSQMVRSDAKCNKFHKISFEMMVWRLLVKASPIHCFGLGGGRQHYQGICFPNLFFFFQVGDTFFFFWACMTVNFFSRFSSMTTVVYYNKWHQPPSLTFSFAGSSPRSLVFSALLTCK